MAGGRSRSLRGRVALAGVAVLALWVILLTTGVNLIVATALADQADDALRARAQAAAATIEVRPDGQIVVRDGQDDAAIDVGTWIFHGSTVIERPAGGENLDDRASTMVGRGQVFDETGGAGGIRWYAEPVLAGQQQVATVVTSLSLAPYQATERLTLFGTIALAALLLVGSYFSLRAGVGRALRPVGVMSRQAALWGADDVDRRFGPGGRPTELEDLAATLDGLLDRQSAAMRHERHFSAEVSHELRTPLARALTDVELLQRQQRSPGEIDQTLESVAADIQNVVDIVETLMPAARQQGGRPPGYCTVIPVLQGLVDRHQPPVPTIRLLGENSVMAGVDAAVLERAMSPLLDNAIRYAAGRIDVDVSSLRGVVRIEVRDDGPGISEADLPSVFEPGRRGSTADEHQGAGLGLSLARRLIIAADGTISALASDHGAVMVVTLPAG